MFNSTSAIKADTLSYVAIFSETYSTYGVHSVNTSRVCLMSFHILPKSPAIQLFVCTSFLSSFQIKARNLTFEVLDYTKGKT